jgi:hypothetical protein
MVQRARRKFERHTFRVEVDPYAATQLAPVRRLLVSTLIPHQASPISI